MFFQTAEFIGNDTSSSAFIYGLMSLTDKISNGLVVVAIQYFIPTTEEVILQTKHKKTQNKKKGAASFCGLMGFKVVSC